MELQDYINERLAKPMGWGAWDYCLHRGDFVMPHANGAGSIAVHATDALRFGYCLLHNGKWKDQQLVPPDYIALCNKPSKYNPHCPFSLQFEHNSDGHVAGAPRDAFYKSGAGGFGIFIVPSLDLVIYKLGGNNGQYDPSPHRHPPPSHPTAPATNGSRSPHPLQRRQPGRRRRPPPRPRNGFCRRVFEFGDRNLFAFAFEVGDLAGDELEGTGGVGDFVNDFAAGVPFQFGGEGGDFEGLREQGVAREDRDAFAENFVVGELAATIIVVIHRGQIVVDQRVSVNAFDCAGVGKSGFHRAAAGFRGRDAEGGAQAFAAGEKRVAHRFVDGGGLHFFGGKRLVEGAIHSGGRALQVSGDVKFLRVTRSGASCGSSHARY
jgi:hypothetical protein